MNIHTFRNSDAVSDCICREDYAVISQVLYPYCHYDDGAEYLSVLQRYPFDECGQVYRHIFLTLYTCLHVCSSGWLA